MLETLLFGIPGVMEALAPDTPVHCSEVVRMEEEFRVYVVEGQIRALCQYKGEKYETPRVDLEVIKAAVAAFYADSHLAGFGIDFAVIAKEDGTIATCLVEVNDGYSLGRYEGLSGKDYTDLLALRWK